MAAKASAGKFYEGLGGQEGGNNAVEKVKAFQAKLNQQLQVLLDKSTPKPLERWLLLAATVLIYFIRVSALARSQHASKRNKEKDTHERKRFLAGNSSVSFHIVLPCAF